MRWFRIKYLFRGLIIIFAFYGCKKVINVNIENAGIQTVITGEIDNKPGPYLVHISKSVYYSSDNVFPPVSGAFVTITGNGLVDTLSEISPGIYSTHKLQGKPGNTYSLYVSAENKIYTAISTMPEPVHLDSLSFMAGRKNNLYAVANFQDPSGVANYYQFIEYADEAEFPDGRGKSVFSDRLSDGRYINLLLYDDSSDIKSGIDLKLQMNCIDKNVYNYFNQLYQISGNGGGFSSPTPANPTGNIFGGALGYFSAHTESSRIVEIP